MRTMDNFQDQQESDEKHIISKMISAREQAHMSYNENYVRIIQPYVNYIVEQMEEHQIPSPIEMAVIMIEQAQDEDDSETKIMNILSASLEIIEAQ